MAGGNPESKGVLAGLVIRAEKLVVTVRLSLEAAVLEQLGKALDSTGAAEPASEVSGEPEAIDRAA